MKAYELRVYTNQDSAEPDLTPMLDVVFILLIFFIVTATFVREEGIDLPQKSPAANIANPQKPVLLRLKSDDRYYINQRQVDRRALEAQLARLHAELPKSTLVIEASMEATTDKLVYALDVARLVGMQVSLADTRPTQ